MKKFLTTCFCLTCVLSLSFCAKGDSQKIIRDFVKTNFPQTSVVNIIKDGMEYDVLLSDNIKIDFDRKTEWEEINCKNATIYKKVPNQFIPKEILNYVQTNYPQNYITKISKDFNKWEIELNNKLEIEFDKKFSILEMDFND